MLVTVPLFSSPVCLIMCSYCWEKLDAGHCSIILITCVFDNVPVLLGEVRCWSLLGLKGLSLHLSNNTLVALN